MCISQLFVGVFRFKVTLWVSSNDINFDKHHQVWPWRCAYDNNSKKLVFTFRVKSRQVNSTFITFRIKRRARGHYVTLIKTGTHLVTCNPRGIAGTCMLSTLLRLMLSENGPNDSQHFWVLLVRDMLDGVGRWNNSKQWKDVHAVHYGKDTTHGTLWTYRIWRSSCFQHVNSFLSTWSPYLTRVRGPTMLKRAVQTDQNIVGLRFGDQGTKEMLRVVDSKVWPVSNFAQQLLTTRNNMQHGVQTDEKRYSQ